MRTDNETHKRKEIEYERTFKKCNGKKIGRLEAGNATMYIVASERDCKCAIKTDS